MKEGWRLSSTPSPYARRTSSQCCGSGSGSRSGLIRIILPDPDRYGIIPSKLKSWESRLFSRRFHYAVQNTESIWHIWHLRERKVAMLWTKNLFFFRFSNIFKTWGRITMRIGIIWCQSGPGSRSASTWKFGSRWLASKRCRSTSLAVANFFPLAADSIWHKEQNKLSASGWKVGSWSALNKNQDPDPHPHQCDPDPQRCLKYRKYT